MIARNRKTLALCFDCHRKLHKGILYQYTYARIRSVLRRSAEQGFEPVDYTHVAAGEREVALIQRLASLPQVVAKAGRTFSPSVIANYAYDLAKEYNQFYHDCPIMREADPAVRSLRLALSAQTADTLRRTLGLLGIAVPERM